MDWSGSCGHLLTQPPIRPHPWPLMHKAWLLQEALAPHKIRPNCENDNRSTSTDKCMQQKDLFTVCTSWERKTSFHRVSSLGLSSSNNVVSLWRTTVHTWTQGTHKHICSPPSNHSAKKTKMRPWGAPTHPNTRPHQTCSAIVFPSSFTQCWQRLTHD